MSFWSSSSSISMPSSIDEQTVEIIQSALQSGLSDSSSSRDEEEETSSNASNIVVDENEPPPTQTNEGITNAVSIIKPNHNPLANLVAEFGFYRIEPFNTDILSYEDTRTLARWMTTGIYNCAKLTNIPTACNCKTCQLAMKELLLTSAIPILSDAHFYYLSSSIQGLVVWMVSVLLYRPLLPRSRSEVESSPS